MNKLIDIRKFSRIAIIQTAFLGDVALALYLVEEIMNLHPKCKITFVTTPASVGLVSCSALVDKIIVFDKRGLHKGWKGIKDISEILKLNQIDCIIGLQRSIRTSLISYLAKPEYSIGFDKSSFSFLYKKRIKYTLALHEVERNKSLLTGFKLSNGEKTKEYKPWGIKIDLGNDDKNYIDNLLINIGIKETDKFVAIAPGSVWETKRWMPEYFKTLINNLTESGYKAILIGSKDDLSYTEDIFENTECFSLVGKTSIPQLLYLLSNCSLTITNDSSPTHFAGLVRCPTITIFGATVPEFGFSPLGPQDKSLGIDSLKCRPCGIHGGRKCPVKTFDCMLKLSPEIVFKEALKILESND